MNFVLKFLLMLIMVLTIVVLVLVVLSQMGLIPFSTSKQDDELPQLQKRVPERGTSSEESSSVDEFAESFANLLELDENSTESEEIKASKDFMKSYFNLIIDAVDE